MKSLRLNWRARGDGLSFDYNGLEIYFRFPTVTVTLPPYEVLHLCEWLMLSPWNDIGRVEKRLEMYDSTPSTIKTALTFSAGVDSTAALQVLPGCWPMYVEREGIPTRIFDQSAHLKFCDEIMAQRIQTNFELMRTTHGLQVGYSTGRGMAVPAILLASYLRLNAIAYGAVLDDNHFPHGIYRPLTDAYWDRQARFLDAGFYCYEPTRGCSEVITCNIVKQGPYRTLARSCLRGTVDEQCGRCYKCYRKSMILGRKLELNASVMAALAKDPPKMAGPMVWAAQRAGVDLPPLAHAKDFDVSFLARHHGHLIDRILPMHIRDIVLGKLESYGIEPMDSADIKQMERIDFRRPE